MNGQGLYPSAPPVLHTNTETWLGFSDLVFIDPAGTGFSKITGGSSAQSSLWSVDGDIDSLATTIRRWSEANNRMLSPKYLAGESYGGFRVPRIGHALQTDQGVGINGLILVSPVLDFKWRRHGGMFGFAGRLPSYAATHLARNKTLTPAIMKPIENYARGAYLTDMAKGKIDRDAVTRIVQSVTKFTGLDTKVVARHAGRIPLSAFIREVYRGKGQVASVYDSLVAGLDPNIYSKDNEADDQMRLGLHAPIIQAMVNLYRNKLKWYPPRGRYLFQNKQAGRRWKWGRRPPEAVSYLRSILALDPAMQVLVTHGYTDLVTPYFETRMVLDQMAPIGNSNRIRFQVYNGGHMFYTDSRSRKAFMRDAQRLISGSRE